MNVCICAIAALASCVVYYKQADNRKTRVTNALQLTATVARSGNDLVLQYEVVNRDRRDVYLLNRLSRSGKISPDVIYVGLDEATGTILLSKNVPELPKGLSPTTLVSPFVTPVRAGTSFSERVPIPVPLRSYAEYLTPDDSHGEIRTFRHIRLKLGYYWRPPGASERTQSIGGVSVILPTFVGRAEFGELQSGAIPVEVPVVVPR